MQCFRAQNNTIKYNVTYRNTKKSETQLMLLVSVIWLQQKIIIGIDDDVNDGKMRLSHGL